MPQILFEWLKKADHGIISTSKFMPQHKSLRDTRSLYKTSKLQESYRKYLLTLSMVINCIITYYDILLFSYFYFVHCTLSLTHTHVRISTHSRHTQAVVCSFAESVYFNINCHSTTATTRKPSHPLFTKLQFSIQFDFRLKRFHLHYGGKTELSSADTSDDVGIAHVTWSFFSNGGADGRSSKCAKS